MPIIKPLKTPTLLAFHAIAAARGDGLRPELVSLFSRIAQGADPSHSEIATTADEKNKTDVAANAVVDIRKSRAG